MLKGAEWNFYIFLELRRFREALDSLHSLGKCREVKSLYNQKGWVGGTNNNNLLNSKFLHSLRSEERVKGGVSFH
jgi:hypothetical protein